ncbi:hypothetical protein [Streptomyces sp. XY431]|uniref:hypothetical protein n=1 Tax=Streptomyces sp. XY431 TaxID=1415562 RepID=UPI0007C87BBA|nr:hypothetical protein [Streptomyces sp. XY431]
MAPNTDADPEHSDPARPERPGRPGPAGPPDAPAAPQHAAPGAAKEGAPVAELVRSMRAHPARLPELLAVFAVRHRGPRAARRIAALRAAHPEATTGDLAARAVDHARLVSQSEGAFVGGPFLWLIPFAFCTALLAQAQLLLELAALAGKDPADRARAPELLVLQGAHPDLAAAERALAAGPEPAAVSRPPGRFRGFWDVIRRMARLLGITSEDAVPPPSRWRSAGEWSLLALVLLMGTVAPLVWLPYMALSYTWATDRLAVRGVAHYFGGDPFGWPGLHRARADPGVVAAAGRALAALLVPVAAVAGLLLADIRLADSRWPVLALVLLALSVTVGALWWTVHRRNLRAARRAARSEHGSEG